MAYNKKYNKSANSKSGKEIRDEMLETVTRQIWDSMKKGVLPWTKGRSDSLGAVMPTNLLTGKRYKGINAISLMLKSLSNGHDSNYYGTFNQVMKNADLKADDPDIMSKKPLTGQKAGAHVIHAQFKWIKADDPNRKSWSTRDKETGKMRYIPNKAEIQKFGLEEVFSHHKAYPVFAYEQLQYVSPKQERLCNMTPVVVNSDIENKKDNIKTEKVVNALLEKLNIKLEHSATFKTPAYNPATDTIQMPPIEMYESNSRYNHSLLHELVHATGHKSRLDRDSLATYHDDPKNRAYEELIAELGGVFLGMEMDIRLPSSSELDNHAAYLKGWMSLLQDDIDDTKFETFNKATQAAERAVSFLKKGLELVFEQKIELAEEKKPAQPKKERQLELEDSGLTP